MVTSSGDKLLEEDVVQAYKDYLFPRTSILTPNKKELSGMWKGIE